VSFERRVAPLVIEWEPGSDRIGDFTWTIWEAVVQEHVLTSLDEEFGGVEGAPVEMWEDPELQKPQHRRRDEPRVRLPYNGPKLYELCPTSWLDLDENRSSVVSSECEVCGTKQFRLNGIEERGSRWDATQLKTVAHHVARERGKGLFLAEEQVQTAHIFRVHQFASWIFCDDAVKTFVERCKFSNVGFLEVGETFVAAARPKK
jgi:hypothetical protein